MKPPERLVVLPRYSTLKVYSAEHELLGEYDMRDVLRYRPGYRI